MRSKWFQSYAFITDSIHTAPQEFYVPPMPKRKKRHILKAGEWLILKTPSLGLCLFSWGRSPKPPPVGGGNPLPYLSDRPFTSKSIEWCTLSSSPMDPPLERMGLIMHSLPCRWWTRRQGRVHDQMGVCDEKCHGTLKWMEMMNNSRILTVRID